MKLGRTGKQFLLYYVLFFMCLAILFIPLYYVVFSMISQSYLDAAGAFLESGLASFENDLGHIEALARSAYEDPQLRRLSYMPRETLTNPDYFYLIPLVDDFGRYFLTTEMVADCGIIYESHIVLTSKRIYFNENEFYPHFFMQAGVPEYSEWRENATGGYSRIIVIPQNDYVTFEGNYSGISSIILYSGSKKDFFFATLRKDYILSRLATDEVLKEGRISLCDTTGRELIDSGLLQEDESEIISLSITGKKKGLSASVSLPRRIFREKLVPFKTISLGFTVLYVIVGVVLSLVFAHRSARPMQKIVDDVLDFSGFHEPGQSTPKPEGFKNDYTYIRHFLLKAGQDFEAFKTKLRQQEELQRENLFERLLYGLIFSAESYETVRQYFPYIPPVFRVAVIALPAMEDIAIPTYAIRQTMIRDVVEPYLPGDCYTHFLDHNLVMILPEEEREAMLNRLRSMSANLKEKLKTPCVIALSGPIKDISNLHQEFYFIRHLLRLPRSFNEDIILQKENMAPHSFPIELLDASRLYEFMLLGEEKKAVEFINNMLYELYSRFMADENSIQQLFFLYRRVLLQIISDLELNNEVEKSIPSYDSKQEVSFLFASLAEAVRKICGLVNSQHAGGNRSFEQAVIAFIDENITNQGLYTKMITGKFRISENRLQSIVRRWTGKSYLEYVESKRMAIAREMLLKTAKSIAAITRDCGYSSENSFYKAFKRFYGAPPSELRKQGFPVK
jgi:AraC-like DNA-binding protein